MINQQLWTNANYNEWLVKKDNWYLLQRASNSLDAIWIMIVCEGIEPIINIFKWNYPQKFSGVTKIVLNENELIGNLQEYNRSYSVISLWKLNWFDRMCVALKRENKLFGSTTDAKQFGVDIEEWDRLIAITTNFLFQASCHAIKINGSIHIAHCDCFLNNTIIFISKIMQSTDKAVFLKRNFRYAATLMVNIKGEEIASLAHKEIVIFQQVPAILVEGLISKDVNTGRL